MPLITRSLNVLARCGNQYRGQKLAPLGLTAAQAPYILHICGKPGLSQEELAQALHVNASNATRQLAALEESGFVERSPRAGDRRVLAVFPTNRAQEACDSIRKVNSCWQAYLTQDMSAEETGLMETLLEKMHRRAILWEEEGAQDR